MIDETLNHITDVIAKHIQEDKVSVKLFVKDYFQINFIEKELAESDNAFLKLSGYLDSLEQYQKPTPSGKNYLTQFLQKSNGSYLNIDAFNDRDFDLPSLPEIGTTELHNKYPNLQSFINTQEENQNLFEQIKVMTKEDLKNYHKYIAIVHADGDYMGKVIETSSNLQDVSQKLFDFANESHGLIKKYGGTTIYAGGDDLLFFAPVKNGKQTIFDLLEDLSQCFDDKFDQATLSFGLSISYHKFPLYEALEISRNLLFDNAKKEPKNAISFKVIKHSGQTFSVTLHKGNAEIYTKFRELLGSIDDQESGNFLGSFHHKLYEQRLLIEAIATNRDRLTNYFKNNFNESGHDTYQPFFTQIGDFIYSVYNSNIPQKHELIYATLRFVKFIKGDSDNE